MREFFKPWRRKAGLLTLGLACVFTAGWVRSHSSYETFTFPLGNDKYVQLAFVYKKLIVGWISIKRTGPQANGKLQLWVTDPRREEMWTTFRIGGIRSRSNPEFVESHSQQTLGSIGAEYFIEQRNRSIPHWSIVVPLTLLSAWLLLSKPQPAKRADPALTNGE